MAQMSHVHGSNALRRRSLFQKGVDSFLMQAGFEEILQFREYLIHIRSQLDFQTRPLFNGFLAEASELFKIHQVKVIKRDKPVGILHQKSLSNDVSVDLIRLGFAQIVFAHGRRFDRVEYTHFKGTGNKVSYKVVAIVCRRFKTDDDVVRIEGIESGDQHMEAISVIRELKRFHEYFAIRRNG